MATSSGGGGRGGPYHGFTEEMFVIHGFTEEYFAIHGFTEGFFAIHGNCLFEAKYNNPGQNKMPILNKQWISEG